MVASSRGTHCHCARDDLTISVRLHTVEGWVPQVVVVVEDDLQVQADR